MYSWVLPRRSSMVRTPRASTRACPRDVSLYIALSRIGIYVALYTPDTHASSCARTLPSPSSPTSIPGGARMEDHGKCSPCAPSCYNTLRCCQKRLSGIPRRRYKRHGVQDNNDVPLNIYKGTTKCAIQADEVLQLEHIRAVYAIFRVHSLDVSPRVAYVSLNIKHAACISVFACARAVSGRVASNGRELVPRSHPRAAHFVTKGEH